MLQPGTIARADDVNKNFQYLLQLIGLTSAPDAMKPPKIKLGPQQNFVLSAEHNVVAGANNFAFLAHNAEMIAVGNSWEYRRINNNSMPTSMELGNGQIMFRVSERLSGQLNPTTDWYPVMGLVNSPDQAYMYLQREWNIKNRITTSSAQSYMRNLTTFLDVPVTVFEGKSLGSGSKVYKPASLSNKIPADANAVIVYCAFTGSTSARWWAYPQGKARQYGGNWSAHAGYRSSGAQQIVPLNGGQFTLEKEGSVTGANFYIQGWLS
jgi:hypothetical protein